MLFVHDGKEGLYVVHRGGKLDLTTSTRVRLSGSVGPGLFVPELIEPDIVPLERGALPEPLRPSVGRRN